MTQTPYSVLYHGLSSPGPEHDPSMFPMHDPRAMYGTHIWYAIVSSFPTYPYCKHHDPRVHSMHDDQELAVACNHRYGVEYGAKQSMSGSAY